MKSFVRKHLCVPGLLSRVRYQYKKIPDTAQKPNKHDLLDCLMSGIALFGLKYPSLLQFNQEAQSLAHNLKQLYGVNRVPSDMSFRERLDPIEATQLQRGITRIVAQLQRGKVLECYRYLDDYCLIAIDGTGYFSSHEVHCDNCCVKNHRDGTKTYYHQMLSAVIVHPNYRPVFPLMLEPIQKKDGVKKNDCEHSALKRMLVNLRTAHPYLKLMVTLDGLYADGVIIRLLKKLDIRYIISANEKDLKYLYEFYHAAKKETRSLTREKREQTLSWVNALPLNATHPDELVNMLMVDETIHQKKKSLYQKFAWITDIVIKAPMVENLMKGGRARWKIENETFNTLKNQGYHFDHNFGHGNQNLSVVMAYLMFTAFIIDQVQEFSCKHFKAALKKIGRLKYLWERMRNSFIHFKIDYWEELYTLLASDYRPIPIQSVIASNTS